MCMLYVPVYKTEDIIFAFSDKGTLEIFRKDFRGFVEWLMSKYPDDAELKERVRIF